MRDILGEGVPKRLKLCRLSGALDRRGRLGRARRMAVAPARATGTQRGHRARRSRQRLPPGDGPGACPCLRVVGDSLKPPAQLDGGRQLALLIEDSADRVGVGLGDNEHPDSMAARTAAGKQARCALASCGMRPAKRGGGQTDLRPLPRCNCSTHTYCHK